MAYSAKESVKCLIPSIFVCKNEPASLLLRPNFERIGNIVHARFQKFSHLRKYYSSKEMSSNRNSSYTFYICVFKEVYN